MCFISLDDPCPCVATRAGEALRLEAASLAIQGGLLDSAETLLLPLLEGYQAVRTAGGSLLPSEIHVKVLQAVARLHVAQVRYSGEGGELIVYVGVISVCTKYI